MFSDLCFFLMLFLISVYLLRGSNTFSNLCKTEYVNFPIVICACIRVSEAQRVWGEIGSECFWNNPAASD